MAYEARRSAHDSFTGPGHNLALRISKHNPAIDDWESKEKHKEKDSALELMAVFKLPPESAAAYNQSFNNWKQAIESRGDCETFEIEAITRVLLGTGNASVFEFGFNLNYPWGVPYIAGTSLKGLMSSYLARHGGAQWSRSLAETAVKSDAQIELFGGVREKSKKDPNSYIGTMLFHDAWLRPWEKRVKGGDWFDEDIITPHYQGYYGEKRLPDGTENPIPIKIAALRPGLKFLVTIQGPEKYRKLVREILLKALAEEGIGGKTAVGYGRFAYVISPKEMENKERSKIANAATEAEFVELYRTHGQNAYRTDFLAAMEKFGYCTELQGMWQTLRPLFYLMKLVESGEIKDLKMLNQRFRDWHNITNWQESEGITDLKTTKDGQALFSLMISKWAGEIANAKEIKIVKDLAYGWSDLKPDADNIMAIFENAKHVWPPKTDLPEYIRSASNITTEDKEFLIEMLQY